MARQGGSGMAATYDRPPALVKEFLGFGTMCGMPLAELYRVYAAALGRPALTPTERMQAVFDWMVAMVDQDVIDDHYSDDDIEQAAEKVEELKQDIEDAAQQMEDGAKEVQDAFDKEYGD